MVEVGKITRIPGPVGEDDHYACFAQVEYLALLQAQALRWGATC